MMTMVLTASAVLAAEYGIRTRVNKAPKQQFPKALGKQYEVRQAHNFGIVADRLRSQPKRDPPIRPGRRSPSSARCS